MANKYWIISGIIGIIVLVLAVGFIYDYSQTSFVYHSQLNNTQPKIVCPFSYELKLLNNNFMSNGYVTHDCENINGGTHEGQNILTI